MSDQLQTNGFKKRLQSGVRLVGTVRADLDNLWKQPGVRLTEGGVMYDNRAPLALVRKSMVWGRAVD